MSVARLHLTVIAKEPVAGRVKTRLVPPLDHATAAHIAAAGLADTFAAVTAAVARRTDCSAVALIDGEPGPWIPPGFEVVRQGAGGLDVRLADAFDLLGPGVIVGMDTPGGLLHLDAALDSVAAGRDVLGLAVDGGYWAIGLAVADRDVVAGVPMSTTWTGAAQLRRLHAAGRSVRLLPMVHDLDRVDDLLHVAASCPGTRIAAAIADVVS